ncbi:hypothetical protein BCS71_10745 [Vibrio lentus]|uniref:hypothetical protein n=1 Tax=Vibrio lentus TaxID=136468 RepID=UPI000C855F29|nr:hypothetical protein [Vibrio lentus]PMI56965.1 hypothetical protein BCU41_08410 [Vibrio lentus]PMI81100.1 hypothetical protein BCU36_14320 [Vibrio lentus]
MTTIGNLVSKEKEIIKKIANNYESNLPSEFYVARRNLLVACSTLAFLMVTALESGKPFIKFTFFVNTEISVETLIFMLVLTCSYFYFRFRALAKIGLFKTHEKSQIDYVLQVSLEKFNQTLQKKIDALYGTSSGSYPRFQFNLCSDTGEYRIKATPQTYFTIHYRLDSKHWGKWTKEEIEDTLNILGMKPKYHRFTDGCSAITVDQTTQLDHIDLSHYKRIERYIRYATNSLFIETLFPMCFYWLLMLSATSLVSYRCIS